MKLFIFAIKFLLFVEWSHGSHHHKNYRKLPKGFLIGSASSAYQIEGQYNTSALSDWDWFTHAHPEYIADGTNGDIASDFYHRYKSDIQMMKDAGLDHFRLSLRWPRILPNGFSNLINPEGIQFYKDVLDELNRQGIKPYVTLAHSDIPDNFRKMGGWLNEEIIEYFAEFSRIVFRELGSRVKFWSTINEPVFTCNNNYGLEHQGPGDLDLPLNAPYLCHHNMLKAHARAYHIYNDEFRAKQKGQIAIVDSCTGFFPLYKNDTESVETAFLFDCGRIFHPIYSASGDYPSIVKERIAQTSKIQGYPKSRLPVLTPFWINYIRGTWDYLGLNHYTSSMTESKPFDPSSGWWSDSGIAETANPKWKIAASDWIKIVPEGFGEVLRKIKNEYNNPPIYILENGYSHVETVNTHDHERIQFLHDYMESMLLAINRDKCNVKAYTVWSLVDNFEWADGYTKRFGMVYIDENSPNRTRIPRDSLSWLRDVIKKRELISPKEWHARKH